MELDPTGTWPVRSGHGKEKRNMEKEKKQKGLLGTPLVVAQHTRYLPSCRNWLRLKNTVNRHRAWKQRTCVRFRKTSTE